MYRPCKNALSFSYAAYKMSVVYKANAWLQVVGICILVSIQYFLWLSIGQYNEIANLNAVILYVVLARVFIFILPGNRTVRFVSEKIVSGKIVVDLLRPIPFILIVFFDEIGKLLFSILYVILPTLVISLFVYHLPVENLQIHAVSIISLIFAFILAFLMNYLIGLISIWVGNIWGFMEFYSALLIIFGGTMIPLSLYPEFLQTIALYTPFQSVFYTPIAMLTGMEQLTSGPIFVQMVWILVCSLITCLLSILVKRNSVYYGG
ncbi:ABC transporter permease [Shouchella clausii]|uniref:ABC transporter permease n=1 Tax=Shouchella clausii TaxID=79880 RepID=UPI000BA64E82|nr:ABC-2 family transporter protein [Shouchella clausii]MEB5481412.1 ABC-2 family transporter protein [Shouchella clausii]PAD14156.1 hypothetical protein CHH74_10095 [Shouchella clausii]